MSPSCLTFCLTNPLTQWPYCQAVQFTTSNWPLRSSDRLKAKHINLDLSHTHTSDSGNTDRNLPPTSLTGSYQPFSAHSLLKIFTGWRQILSIALVTHQLPLPTYCSLWNKTTVMNTACENLHMSKAHTTDTLVYTYNTAAASLPLVLLILFSPDKSKHWSQTGFYLSFLDGFIFITNHNHHGFFNDFSETLGILFGHSCG